MPPAPAEEARAWLVFRLGPHLMCASALDVEGIIEPVRPRQVPFSPPYMIGWFDFRGRVAAVISLRRKFGVRSGEDSDACPYVVARVAGDLAAFWVDEVRDVLESHQAEWQPMPEIPGAAAFDCYTIQDGEVILRTTFERLLRADTVVSFSTGTAPVDAAPAAPTLGAAEVGATPAPASVKDEAPQAGSAEASPTAPEPSEPDPIESEPPPAQPEARPAGTPQRAAEPGPPPGAAGNGRDAAPRPRSSSRDSARPAASARAPETPRAPPPSPGPSQRAGQARYRPAAPAADYFAAAPPPLDALHDVVDDLEPAHEPERRPRRRTRLLAAIGLVFLLALAWLAWRALTPENPAPAPVAATGNLSPPPPTPVPPPVQTPAVTARAAEPVAAAPNSPPPATAPVPEPKPAAAPAVERAPARKPEAKRILTIEGERFTLTVDRPAKPRPPSAPSAAPAQQAAGTPAHPEGGAERMTHVVVRGDTLGHIAHRYLGDAARYPELARLSRIRNPHLIYPGDIVTIHKGHKASSRP